MVLSSFFVVNAALNRPWQSQRVYSVQSHGDCIGRKKALVRDASRDLKEYAPVAARRSLCVVKSVPRLSQVSASNSHLRSTSVHVVDDSRHGVA